MQTRSTDEWLADSAREIDNLRAALDWAFSPGGDASIGVALTAAAVPLWMHLSLMEECRGRVEQALTATRARQRTGTRAREMKLFARACGVADVYQWRRSPRSARAGQSALEIAESLVDAEYQLRSLWGLWSFHINSGQHHSRSDAGAKVPCPGGDRPEPNDRLVGERLIGTSQYFLGD